jgi:cytochrome-b5 reductase
MVELTTTAHHLILFSLSLLRIMFIRKAAISSTSFVFNRISPRLTMSTLPASMQGPPVKSRVEPGKCQFGEDPIEVPLIERTHVSSTSAVLRFGLPDSTKPLNLSTCACILATAMIDGESITRPYTPISTNAEAGHFDMLIKNYGKDAHMSRHMHEIQPGDKIAFKHIKFNVKIQAPFPFRKIVMLVGGTGVTPMIQALHAILGDENGAEVAMLYGSRVQEDILGKELLHKWAADYPNQLKLVDVLSNEPAESDWTGARGIIDKALLEKYLPGPNEKDISIFICGPPPMYNALTGPREDKELSGLLKEMGYTTDQVFKF